MRPIDGLWRWQEDRRWRGVGRVADRLGAPRIGVIGNCQAESIAQAMRLMLPDAEVTAVSVYAVRRRGGGLARKLAGCEAVFVISLPGTANLDPEVAALRAAGLRVIPAPLIVFSAFHPDLVYVGEGAKTIQGRHVRSPIGPYNSALALYGYLCGLTVEQTIKLFCEQVYGRVGYFDVWQSSTEYLRQLGREADFELDAELISWSRRGAFMHSINHPKPYVLADIARGLLAKSGMRVPEMDLEGQMEDDLIHQGAWPIYPEIAARFGIPGSYVFTTRSRARAPRLIAMSLADFVGGSFDLYRQRSRGDLACPRVDGWLTDALLRRDLSAMGYL